MKVIAYLAVALMLPVAMLAQTVGAQSPQSRPPATPPANMPPALPFPGGFNPPAGMFDQFWNDPATVAELRLSEAQRKQLRDAALNTQLALIDGGADALKSLARLSAIYQSDQLDDAAYRQQLKLLADAAGKVIQDLGEMAAAPRRVLTVEQWHKLQTLQRAKQTANRPAGPRIPPAGNAPPSPRP